MADRGVSSTGVKLYHEGVDIIAASGSPIRAVVDGTVARISTSTRGGNQLYLEQADGSYYFHAHISRYADGLVQGQKVTAGQVIAYVGQTGDAQYSVAHLHFEVHPAWNAKKPINPFPVVGELPGCGRGGTGALASLPDSVTENYSGTTANAAGTGGVVVAATPADTPSKSSNGFDGLGAVQPKRLADSRQSFSLTTFTPGTVNYLTIAGHGGVPANATAVMVNMTVTNPAGAGWLRAWPCGQSIPDTSAVNYADGQTVANGALMQLGAGKLCFQATTSLDLIVDVMGWQGNGGSLGFVATGQLRLFDSRSGAPVDTASVVRVKIPGSSPKAATLNITAVSPAAAGHLTVWPCDALHPVTSSLNFSDGEVIANAVTVGVSASGEVCLDASTSSHLIVDLSGVWSEKAGARPTSVTPLRLLDSRGSKPAAGFVQKVQVTGRAAVPPAATAAQVNITVTDPHGAGFVTAWPCGQPQPNVSNVNYANGETVANSATVPLGGGQLCVAASSPADLIIDVTGYLK